MNFREKVRRSPTFSFRPFLRFTFSEKEILCATNTDYIHIYIYIYIYMLHIYTYVYI